MLSFEDLGAGNWKKYRELVLQSESVFPENARSSPGDFDHMFSGSDCLAMVATVDSKYIGNIIGCGVPPEDRSYYEITDAPENSRIIYILNIVINPEHQGRGFGKQLLWEFIKTAKAKGYDHVAGHFRQNGSLHLIRKFGAKEEGVCNNWENTGEDCVVCCLDIRNISESDFKGLLTVEKPSPYQPKEETCQNPMPVLPGMDETPLGTEPHLNEPDFAGATPHF